MRCTFLGATLSPWRLLPLATQVGDIQNEPTAIINGEVEGQENVSLSSCAYPALCLCLCVRLCVCVCVVWWMYLVCVCGCVERGAGGRGQRYPHTPHKESQTGAACSAETLIQTSSLPDRKLTQCIRCHTCMGHLSWPEPHTSHTFDNRRS